MPISIYNHIVSSILYGSQYNNPPLLKEVKKSPKCQFGTLLQRLRLKGQVFCGQKVKLI